ncbi:hypothetical protein [Parasphingorhabdus sp.]|uniref:hypothetical protein n=1 Tax=Parasphingorhabdus sp. TaxID=2709688 RepID=UPI003BB09AC2
MKIDDAIEKFRKGSFEADFIQISIQQDIKVKPLMLIGAGLFRQDETGQIKLKCYAKASSERDSVDLLNNQFNRRSGELFTDEDYFNIQAIDVSNNKWVCERTLISKSWSMPLSAGAIRCPLRFGPCCR